MFDDLKRPNAAFFVVRTHRDLSWYLSIDTQPPAANDGGANRARPAGAAEELGSGLKSWSGAQPAR